MILRTFVEKCRESQLRSIMGQIARDAWIGGWGQPNLGNACILGTYGPATHPLHQSLQSFISWSLISPLPSNPI